MKAHQKIMLAVVGGSFVLHLAAWAFVGRIKGERKHDYVAISLAESKKKEKDKPKPPPKPVEVKPRQAKVRSPAPKAEALPPPVPQSEAPKPTNLDALPDLGAMGNLGGGSGPGIPVGSGGGGGGGPAQAAPAATTTRRHVELAPTSDCTEDLVKPKLEAMIKPPYTSEGRQANVEGLVRLEITVDATGHVVGVKMLRGLGYGLDEAAIDTVKRQWSFKPATRCGRNVPATIRASVTFNLS